MKTLTTTLLAAFALFVFAFPLYAAKAPKVPSVPTQEMVGGQMVCNDEGTTIDQKLATTVSTIHHVSPSELQHERTAADCEPFDIAMDALLTAAGCDFTFAFPFSGQTQIRFFCAGSKKDVHEVSARMHEALF